MGEAHDSAERKTEGIVRHSLDLPCGAKGPVKLNVWDFSGQDHLHSAHQFFFTAHSVYLLVLDSQDERAEYWLRLIQTHAGDSPVIVVGQLLGAPFWEKFPQIKKCVAIDQVKPALAKVVDEWVDHTEVPFRRESFALKDALEKDAKSFLTLAQYDAVCAEQRVEVQDREALLHYLHDLGIMLHFGSHPVARDKHVLPPDWLIAALYRVLNDSDLHRNGGILQRPDLHRILTGVPGHDYDSQDEEFILELLHRFELCFPVDGGAAVLLPDLLPKELPPIHDSPEVLVFRYQYAVLPGSIMTRFLVKMHPHLEEHRHWRTGAVLQRGRCRAKVVADLDHAHIDILIDGPKSDRRQLLEVIRNAFESIHATCKDALEVRELLPVPGHESEELLDFETVLKAEHDGQKFIHTQSAGRVPLLVLLQSIEGAGEEPKRFGERNPIGLETMAAKAGTFPPIPKPKPKQVPEPQKERHWGKAAIATALAVALLATAMVFSPWLWARITLGAIAVTTTFVFARDPHFFHRHIALVVFATAVAANSLGYCLHAISNSKIGPHWDNDTAIAFSITCAVMALVLVLLDTKTRDDSGRK
jgi:internalin A